MSHDLGVHEKDDALHWCNKVLMTWVVAEREPGVVTQTNITSWFKNGFRDRKVVAKFSYFLILWQTWDIFKVWLGKAQQFSGQAQKFSGQAKPALLPPGYVPALVKNFRNR